jgi:hypothetical protein
MTDITEARIAEIRARHASDVYSVFSGDQAIDDLLAALDAANYLVDEWRQRAIDRSAECDKRFRAQHDAIERAEAAETRALAAEAERDRWKAALATIAKIPEGMIWGEDYEVREAMKKMEEIALAALAQESNGT